MPYSTFKYNKANINTKCNLYLKTETIHYSVRSLVNSGLPKTIFVRKSTYWNQSTQLPVVKIDWNQTEGNEDQNENDCCFQSL